MSTQGPKTPAVVDDLDVNKIPYYQLSSMEVMSDSLLLLP